MNITRHPIHLLTPTLISLAVSLYMSVILRLSQLNVSYSESLPVYVLRNSEFQLHSPLTQSPIVKDYVHYDNLNFN